MKLIAHDCIIGGKIMSEILNWRKYKEAHADAIYVEELTDFDHSFKELYDHRRILSQIIFHTYKDYAWKSWLHYDGTMYDDYFIVGIGDANGYFSYHYHKDYWDDFDVTEVPNAPKWSKDINIPIEELPQFIEQFKKRRDALRGKFLCGLY